MKKIIFVVLFIAVLLSSTMIAIEISAYFVANKSNYKEDSVDFLVDFLWDQEYGGFYSNRFDNASFPERGGDKFTSFNIWAIRSLLQYSVSQNDNSTFEEYGVDALNFIFTYLYNATNKGIFHWVFQNGSLPEMSDTRFNNSIYQIGTYQAWVLITLLEAYEYTGNMTYVNVWGKNLANFLIKTLWDSTNGGFYESFLPYYDLIPFSNKYTWYQAWPALALLNYYEMTGNETMLYYANLTLEFMINYLWNTELGCFIDYCLENGTPTLDSQVTLYDQAAALLTLSELIGITKNQTYTTEYLVPILNFTHTYLWNGEFKQFYAGCDVNKTNVDPTLRPSDLSLWLFALKQSIDLLNNSEIFDVELSKNLLSHSISHMIEVAWDKTGKGFYRKIYLNGTLIETEKWTIEQALPIFLFFEYFPVNYFNFYLISIYLGILIGSIMLIVYVSFTQKKPQKSKRKPLPGT